MLCFIFYFIFLLCPLSGPVLTYISLLIIPCMIVYVTNNKEPWTSWTCCPIEPLFSPRKFLGGIVGLLPKRPSLLSCHGLPSPQICHGRPSSLLRHGRPSSPIRHGRPSSPLRRGSQNGRRPGGLLSCPVSVSLEASRVPTPPPRMLLLRCGTHLLGGGGGGGGGGGCNVWILDSCFLVFPLSFLSFLIWCFLFLFLLVNHRLVLSPVLYYSSRLRISLFCFISLQFSPCLCRVLKYVRLMLYSLLFSSFILLKNLLFLKPLSPCLPGSANHYRNTKTNPNPNHIVSTCS